MIHKDCHITLPHQVCEECRLQTLALAQGRIPYQSDGRRGSAAVLAPQQSQVTNTYIISRSSNITFDEGSFFSGEVIMCDQGCVPASEGSSGS